MIGRFVSEERKNSAPTPNCRTVRTGDFDIRVVFLEVQRSSKKSTRLRPGRRCTAIEFSHSQPNILRSAASCNPLGRCIPSLRILAGVWGEIKSASYRTPVDAGVPSRRGSGALFHLSKSFIFEK